MGSWQHGEYSSLYEGFLPNLTGLVSGVTHNGENFSIKVVTKSGDKIEFSVLVGLTVGKVILHVYKNKSKMMSQGAKVLADGMKASEFLARNLGNMLQEVDSNKEQVRLAKGMRERQESETLGMNLDEDGQQQVLEQSRNMEHKRRHPKTPEQRERDNGVKVPTGDVDQSNFIREMQLKNMELVKKLKESDAVLVKEKQEKERITKKLTRKLKLNESALQKEKLVRATLDKQLVDEREAWKKYCEDLERQLNESNST